MDDGTVKLIGDGRRTVCVQQIKERFASLEIRADWWRVARITETGNEIEHDYTKVSRTLLRTLIADALVVVIRDFVWSELRDAPRTVLGDDSWQRVLDVAAVYEQERGECDALLSRVDWASATLE